MRSITLLLLMLPAMFISVQAQDLASAPSQSYYQYIYQITNEEAFGFMKKGRIRPGDISLFHTKVDSFPFHEIPPALHTPGHYLFVKALGNQVDVELNTINNTSVYLLDNQKDLAFQIKDIQGRSLNDLDVRIGNRMIAFDPESGSYLEQRSNAWGWLSYEYEGHLNIHRLRRSQNQGFFIRTMRFILNNTPFTWVIAPMNLAFSFPIDLVKTLDYRYPVGVINELFLGFKSLLGFDHDWPYESYSGYIVFNKPKYRPNETVHFKAFIVDSQRKASQEAVNLKLFQSGKGEKFIQQIEAYAPGSYEGSFILHDSLDFQLDEPIYVSVQRPNGPQIIGERIQYADYELKGINLRISKQQSFHYLGQNLELEIKGQDENALPLFDARLEISILPDRVLEYFSDHTFLPDTILFLDMPLDASAPTIFSISDSLFPEMNLNYQVRVKLISFDNQVKENIQRLHFYHKREEVEYRLKDSLITFYYRENGISKEVQALLINENKDGVASLSRYVDLPFTQKINPAIYRYKVKYRDKEVTLRPEPGEAELNIINNRSSRDVRFSIRNPRDLVFTWFLYKNDEELARGEARSLNLEETAAPIDHYHLLIQYLWAGEMKELWSTSTFQPKTLNISVRQPERVFPGEMATIEVEVRDAYGHPAPHTDLTAFAWTRKFSEQPPTFSVNNMRYGFPAPYNSFSFNNQKSRRTFYYPQNRNFWFAETGLDTMLYFQYRFPEKELFIHQEETFNGQTQFSPFVMNKGRQIPIQAIYVNDVPVYTSLAINVRPWSFVGMPGRNHIRLRTRRQEIVIDSLYLEAGKKTFMSLDLEKVEGVRVKRAHARISRRERQTLFPLHHAFRQNNEDELYWTENDGEISLLNPQWSHSRTLNQNMISIVGPLLLDSAEIFSQEGLLFSIPLRPGLIQYFSDTKVNQVSPLNPNLYYSYWTSRTIGNLDEEVLTSALLNENLRRILEFQLQPAFQYQIPNRTTWGMGKLIIKREMDPAIKDRCGEPQHILLKEIAHPENPGFYPGSQSVFENLEAGRYSLVFVFKDRHFMETAPFEVIANGQNYYKIRLNEMPMTDSEMAEVFETLASRFRLSVEKKGLASFAPMLFQKPTIEILRGETVSGRVFDASDFFPLPGVYVIVPGTNIGTITDLDGRYSIQVPPGMRLRFSFIGMEVHEMTPGRSIQDVFLNPDPVSLDEVVVVARGSSVSRALTGMVPGIRVRGFSGLYGNRASEDAVFCIVESDVELEELSSKQDQFEATSPFSLRDFTDWRPGDQAGSIRSNFSDYAYWQPRLRTDEQGKAAFKVKFPDDITYWNTYVYAMNDRLQTGRHFSGIQSFQALTARLSLPRFLINSDTTEALGRITAYLQDTLSAATFVEVNGQQSKTYDHQVFQSRIDTLSLTAENTDSLRVKYYLEFQGFIDGEERKIPVYPQGLEKTCGHFWSLQSDTSFSIGFEPELGEVNLYVKDNPLEYFLGDIEHLIQFPYQCNEQEASRLIGLLVKKKVNERLGRHFWEEGLIRRTIGNLEKNQNEEGLWGWWNKESNTNIWMSEHVMKALQLAIKNGYEVNLSRPVTAEMLAWQWEKASTNRDRISLINLMLMQKVEQDYSMLINRLKSEEQSWRDFYDIAELEHNAGLRNMAAAVLDSARVSFFGNLHFRGTGGPYAFQGTTLTNSLAAYRIIEQAGQDFDEYLDPIFYYLLESRDMSYPLGTYFSSNQLLTLLPSLLNKVGHVMEKATLTLTGAVDTVAVEFPLDLQYRPDQALHITKTGLSPLYLTTYQRYWETKPSLQGNEIRVTTWFEGIEPEESLEAGKEVVLKATLTLENEAEYLMLEVPIPAGCSYADHQPKGPGEVHREQWRNRTTLFFNRLRSGTYTYEIKLLPRFSGSYTLNPAKAELMYFPVFNGNNEMRKVVIE